MSTLTQPIDSIDWMSLLPLEAIGLDLEANWYKRGSDSEMVNGFGGKTDKREDLDT